MKEQLEGNKAYRRCSTKADWIAEGERRFGPDRMKWRFKCPVCGWVQTPADYKAAGAPEGAVAFSCIGRWIEGSQEAFRSEKRGPCTYAGEGLFRLNPVDVEGQSVFEFAESAEGETQA